MWPPNIWVVLLGQFCFLSFVIVVAVTLVIAVVIVKYCIALRFSLPLCVALWIIVDWQFVCMAEIKQHCTMVFNYKNLPACFFFRSTIAERLIEYKPMCAIEWEKMNASVVWHPLNRVLQAAQPINKLFYSHFTPCESVRASERA